MNESKIENEKHTKKNIRDIYLKAVNNNKGFYRRNKKKGISNLNKSNAEINSNSSIYLQKEYSLVKRIIQDTKELKIIKSNSELANIKNDLPLASTTRSNPIANAKTIEEYNHELLELKKTLKVYQDNEIVNKAKFEYYDNELSKKESEIIDLLDSKKNEELRINSDSKSDLLAFIYHLKQKTYKLEFSLKRKENELSKLRNELKTTNIKQLKTQNERLRLELGKSLMNEKKIIEAFEREGLLDKNGFSYYDSEKRKNDSEISLHRKEKLKESIANELSQERLEDDYDFRNELKDFKRKMTLRGSLKQKLEILDLRENELLKEIERLNEVLEKNAVNERLMVGNSIASLRNENVSRSVSPKDRGQRNRSIEKIQSILKGHLERVNSLNKINDLQHQQEVLTKKPHKSLRGSQESLNSFVRDRDASIERQNRSREFRQRRPSHHSQQFEEQERLQPRGKRQDNFKKNVVSESSDDSISLSSRSSKKELIEQENVSEVDTKGGCCGRSKSKKK